MASSILAIDQGTSSSRAIVFGSDGSVLGVGQEPFDMSFPADGWVEQDPEVLWDTTLRSIRSALAAAGIAATGLAAVGITNQRETTLVWERATGRCVYNAIVWQDRRTAARCQALRADGLADQVARETGLVIDPYFSATKLAWLLDSHPGLRARAAAGELCFGTVDSFLIWRLTGGRVHATDASNASRTMLFDSGGAPNYSRCSIFPPLCSRKFATARETSVWPRRGGLAPMCRFSVWRVISRRR